MSSGNWRPSCLGLDVLIAKETYIFGLSICCQQCQQCACWWPCMSACTVTTKLGLRVYTGIIFVGWRFIFPRPGRTSIELYAKSYCFEPYYSNCPVHCVLPYHYGDVIMSVMASQITGVSIVWSAVFFRRRSKKTLKLRVSVHCKGNLLATGGFTWKKQ